MGLAKVVPLCEYFKLSFFEKQYFIFLYLKNTANEESAVEFFSSILRSYLAFNRNQEASEKMDELKSSQNFVFRNWVHMAILGLANLADYQHDKFWIQEKLGGDSLVSLLEIEASLNVIEGEGLFLISSAGVKRKNPTFISNVVPVDHEDWQRFKTGLFRACTALDKKGLTQLHRPSRFQMYCLSVTESESKELIALYDQLDEKIKALSKGARNPERLFLFQIIFFQSQNKTSSACLTKFVQPLG